MSEPDNNNKSAAVAKDAAQVIETARMIFEGVAVLMTIYKIVEPRFLDAFADFRKLFESGEVTQADIDALVARVNEQSAQIQAS